MNLLASFSLLVFLSTGLFLSHNVLAGNGDNVGGFAWSGQQNEVANGGLPMGWISFNNKTITDSLGTYPGGGGANFGVDINDNAADTAHYGHMSGQAWTAAANDASGKPQGLGYISFDESEMGAGCNNAPCRAWVTTAPDASGRYWVNGWARVMFKDGTANSGGWDGWIHLNYNGSCDTDNDGKSNGGAGCPVASTPVYGVYIDSDGDFHGYAWADQVLGWIHFNGPTYKVHTTAQFIPQAKMTCNTLGCTGGSCDAAMWEAFQQKGDCADCFFKIANSSTGNVRCANWKLGGSAYSHTYKGGAAMGMLTLGTDVPLGTYNLTLTVSDDPSDNDNCNSTPGHFTSVSQPITIRKEIAADFECTLDEPPTATSTWQSCNNFTDKKKLVKGETLYLRDTSTVSFGGSGFSSTAWTVNGAPMSVDANGYASFTAVKGDNNMRLDVVDDNAANHGSDYMTGRDNCKKLNAKSKNLPEWKEISPVGMIWKHFVASVSQIFGSL